MWRDKPNRGNRKCPLVRPGDLHAPAPSDERAQAGERDDEELTHYRRTVPLAAGSSAHHAGRYQDVISTSFLLVPEAWHTLSSPRPSFERGILYAYEILAQHSDPLECGSGARRIATVFVSFNCYPELSTGCAVKHATVSSHIARIQSAAIGPNRPAHLDGEISTCNNTRCTWTD
jgi:hypothetical protein